MGGVQYIVAYVGFEKGTNNLFALQVRPALPFDSFTLTLDSTELSVGSTDFGAEGALIKNTGQTAGTSFQLSLASPRRAQAFTTGPNDGGYRLDSIGVGFEFLDDALINSAGSQLTVTLNAVSGGNPGGALCTLSDPVSITPHAVNTFDASTCPALAASTTYFVVIERVVITSGNIYVGANHQLQRGQRWGGGLVDW